MISFPIYSLLPILPLLAVGSALAFLVVQSIYRVFWHPLAGFPGPKLAALTKWYEFYFDMVKGHGGQFAWEIRRMHEVYGPIVRINPDELHVEDPEWFETLYSGNPTQRDKYWPAASMAGATLGTFGTVAHDAHRKRRLANSHLLSSKAVDGAEPLIQQEVQTLSDKLKNSFENGEILELRLNFLAFTTDTITRHALGESRELQKNPVLAQQWSTTIRAVAQITPLVKQFPWLIKVALNTPLVLFRLVLPDLARLVEFHQDMHFHAQRFVSGLENQEKLQVDAPLFRCIDESNLPPQEKSVRRLAHEAVVVIAAGSETTSKALTWSMFYILSNEHVLQKLLEEIMQIMPDASKLPSTKDIENSPYIVAVVRESLRLSAFITSRSPLQAPGELVYKDWRVPAKTPISMTTHDILLDQNIFADPMKFDPDRWLVPNPPPASYFVAFGKGTRMCQGVKFAYSELYMVLTTLLRRFEFQLYDTNRDRDIDLVRDCFIGEPNPDSVGVRVKIVRLRA